MADLAGKDKQERAPKGRIFTVWSPKSFSPDSHVSAEKPRFIRSRERGCVRTHEHGIQMVLFVGKHMLVLNEWGKKLLWVLFK